METHIWLLAEFLFRNEKQYENFQNISAIELHFKYIFFVQRYIYYLGDKRVYVNVVTAAPYTSIADVFVKSIEKHSYLNVSLWVIAGLQKLKAFGTIVKHLQTEKLPFAQLWSWMSIADGLYLLCM